MLVCPTVLRHFSYFYLYPCLDVLFITCPCYYPSLYLSFVIECTKIVTVAMSFLSLHCYIFIPFSLPVLHVISALFCPSALVSRQSLLRDAPSLYGLPCFSPYVLSFRMLYKPFHPCPPCYRVNLSFPSVIAAYPSVCPVCLYLCVCLPSCLAGHVCRSRLSAHTPHSLCKAASTPLNLAVTKLN